MNKHYVITLFGHKILSLNKKRLDIFRTVRQSMKLNSILKSHKNMPIFVMSPFIPYYSPMKQRFQHFAQLLAKKGYLVFYCTDYLCDREICMPEWKDFIEVSDNLYLADCFDVINKKVENSWFYYTPIAWYSIADFMQSKKNNKIVYDHIDNFDVDSNKDIAQANKLRHRKIAGLCDAASYSSKKLKEDFENLVDENKQMFIQNGVDYEHFANVESNNIPIELEDVINQGKPIIGYHGALTDNWIDFDLISETAKAYSEFNIVLIGAVCSDSDKICLDNILAANPNIHYIQAVSYKYLPQYTRYFDIAIIPFKEGQIALNTNPIKLFENMAMGIPTVVTKDLVECKGYDGVFVSENRNQFICDIKNAFEIRKSDRFKEKLKNYAKNCTWDSQVDKLIGLMEKG